MLKWCVKQLFSTDLIIKLSFAADRAAGATIAPPSSLDEEPVKLPSSGGLGAPSFGGKFGGSSIAAKIMAKYGFKVGRNW